MVKFLWLILKFFVNMGKIFKFQYEGKFCKDGLAIVLVLRFFQAKKTKLLKKVSEAHLFK